MVRTSSLKNKTYEEIYGEEKAKEMKEIKKIRITEWHKKNKNTEEYKRRGENISKANKGKEGRKLNLPNEIIIRLYSKENVSPYKIAKEFNCGLGPIYRILKENNIKIKGVKYFLKGKPSPLRLIKDEQEVINMYLNENLSGVKIANRFNCYPTTIYNILKRNNIQTKGTKFFLKGKVTWNKNKKMEEKLYPNYGMRNKKHSQKAKENMRLAKLGKEGNSIRKDIESKEDEIINLYNKNHSLLKISKIFRCSDNVIKRIIKKNNIKIRPRKYYKQTEEVKQILRQYKGERAVNWQGGKSFEPYGLAFNKKLKEQIRKRDDYICQECRKPQEKLKRKLSIHHIDYNKQNNSIFNLISLCKKCHGKTQYNRKHWENYFKMKIFLKEFFNPQNIKVFENKQLIAMERLK